MPRRSHTIPVGISYLICKSNSSSSILHTDACTLMTTGWKFQAEIDSQQFFSQTLVKLIRDCSAESYFTITTADHLATGQIVCKNTLILANRARSFAFKDHGRRKIGGGVTPEQLGRIRNKFSRG
ncbi:hypothetical protein TNCT_83641 [Trichonephila clavata]|uniref:Uncharacterized protein n=1 Tax=Trichonephila clavata TaxID=2740835 RepID=A0A8X6IMF8_TRICU|nr:hypothetical protein TNCT_83641 [Trichonephila clavata]